MSLRPSTRALGLVTLAACALGPAATADANGAGGASPDQADPSRTTGGAGFGRLRAVPVATRFAVSSRRLVIRIDEQGVRSVRAHVEIQARGQRNRKVALGRIRTNRVVTLKWPAGRGIRPGRYRVVLVAVDPDGGVLSRSPGRRGVASLHVPKPKVVVKRRPVAEKVPDVPKPTVHAGGVFPVQGPWSLGDGLGAARNGHTHQGADVIAAEQTPVVAPVAGTIAHVDYQRRGAGWYVVENAADGRAFFFAHCRTNSISVSPGQAVAAGARLCGVGHTGDAAGPHLHFEIWEGGWRVDSHSRFVDPVPQLKAWAG